MDSLEVYVGKTGFIVIKQDSAAVQDTAHVTSQVETVIRWLQETKAEAELLELEELAPRE
jgi:hypothetical protein